jgi:predicted nucleic acid-binding protein
MVSSVLADSSFLIALLNERDADHQWAVTQAHQLPPPWKTCEAVLSEAFHLLRQKGMPALAGLIEAEAVGTAFQLAEHWQEVISLMKKYANVPMSLADACLVRMSEVMSNPVILTTDSDFRIYRRHTRQTVPCVMPVRPSRTPRIR